MEALLVRMLSTKWGFSLQMLEINFVTSMVIECASVLLSASTYSSMTVSRVLKMLESAMRRAIAATSLLCLV
jgi:hypothetical protein